MVVVILGLLKQAVVAVVKSGEEMIFTGLITGISIGLYFVDSEVVVVSASATLEASWGLEMFMRSELIIILILSVVVRRLGR